MDANKDWELTEKNTMWSFIESNHLVDAMQERCPNAKLPTYCTGSCLDYILMDQAILPAVKCIGQLGTHEGLVSDHLMLHMDLDERELSYSK